MLIKLVPFWNLKLKKLIPQKLKERFVCIGSKDNVKRVITVNTYMYSKKKRSLPVNTSFKRALARKVTSVFTAILILQLAKGLKSVLIMKEVFVDKELPVLSFTLQLVTSVKIICMDFARKDLNVSYTMEKFITNL